ncbi:hypothetical protein HYV86_00245 [Candidatus Woesearchaeota archaeon]|nr:hypothetical protein [Candidatus Woesearchaeota archaeon]
MEIKTLLKEFGFTEYDARVYMALATLHNAKASDIAKQSNLPTNKVYESLIRLASQGFISIIDLTPRQYKIVGLEKFREIMESRKQHLDQLGQGLNQLQQEIATKSITSQDIALVLKGKEHIVRKLNEITPLSKKYAYSCVGRLIYHPASVRVVSQAIKRGVDVRFLVQYHPEAESEITKWSAVGVKIRYRPTKDQESIRFSTIDDKYARITFGAPEITKHENYISFWLESPAFSSLLKDQFLTMWRKAKE